jgi:hypothetical protein
MISRRDMRLAGTKGSRHASSRRRPGPITRGGDVAEGVYLNALMLEHGVWVPACAGTTQIVSDTR